MDSNNNFGIDEKFICPICKSVMIEILTINLCNHSFCTDCIHSLNSNSINTIKK